MNPPDVASFKSQFVRDFPFGNTDDKVMDSDISNAQRLASFLVNEGLFSTESDFQFAYNYLSAHYLVTNIKASSQGLGGSYSWLESSKTVGSVSQSFAIPPDILKNPQLALIAKTNYGATYLSIVIPLSYGHIVISEGNTSA